MVRCIRCVLFYHGKVNIGFALKLSTSFLIKLLLCCYLPPVMQDGATERLGSLFYLSATVDPRQKAGRSTRPLPAAVFNLRKEGCFWRARWDSNLRPLTHVVLARKAAKAR